MKPDKLLHALLSERADLIEDQADEIARLQLEILALETELEALRRFASGLNPDAFARFILNFKNGRPYAPTN